MSLDTALIGGPYTAPACHRGSWIDDVIDGRIEVGGWTDAPLSWPRRKKRGRAALILTDELARAVRTESAAAICHWWGVSQTKVWQWRQALGVRTTPGSQRIARRGVPPEAAARGRERAALPDARAKLSASKMGVPAPPAVRAGLLRAAKRPRSPEWGKRANQWMQDAKARKKSD